MPKPFLNVATMLIFADCCNAVYFFSIAAKHFFLLLQQYANRSQLLQQRP